MYLHKLRELIRRLTFYLRRDRFDTELEAEMRFHLEMKTAADIAAAHIAAADTAGADIAAADTAGADIEEGRRKSRSVIAEKNQFGNVTLLHERSREMWAIRWIDELVQDIRYGIRTIKKSPALALVVVASMALAIGANTAVFSIVNAVLLRNLPVTDPGRLVLFLWEGDAQVAIQSHSGSIRLDKQTGLDKGSSLSTQEFQRMQEANATLTDLFAFAPIYDNLNVGSDGAADIASGQMVSGDYYNGLGVRAVLGRTIMPMDDQQSAEPVAVITYDYWKKRFFSDPAIIGKKINLNAAPFTVIGVSQPEFDGASEIGMTADVSVPLSVEQVIVRGPIEGNVLWRHWLRVMGRLTPGVTIAQARSNLEPVFQQTALETHEAFVAAHPDSKSAQATAPYLLVVSGSRGGVFFRGDYSSQLHILLAIVGFVLLIACVNTANLLLARSAARGKEIAVRTALGAARLRLIRQLLTESLLLSLAAGVAGVVLAYWLKNALLPTVPWRENAADAIHPTLDIVVLVFTFGVSLGTGLVFGIAPALKTTQVNPGSSLKENSTALTAGRGRLGLGRVLVVAQVALSLMLLIGAGLFVRTLDNLNKVDYGFNARNVLLFHLDPTQLGYKGQNLVNIYSSVSDRISAIPGVQSASMSYYPLLSGSEWTTEKTLVVSGSEVHLDQPVYLLPVRPNFLDTMGIPLLLGRALREGDTANSMKVVLVNQTFSKMLFQDENPVGRKITFGPEDKLGTVEIVGVARDTKYDDLRSDAPPLMYLPYAQCMDNNNAAFGGMSFEVKTYANPLTLAPAVRSAVQSVDANLSITDIKTQQTQNDQSMANEKLLAGFTATLGLLALLLACLGLYGVLSYNISRRTGEIGIRMALGARVGQVRNQVMRETMTTVAIGVVLGLLGSIAAARLGSALAFFNVNAGDSPLLFGITPRDPVVLLLSSLSVLVVAAAAGYFPARRASLIDPLTALRYE